MFNSNVLCVVADVLYVGGIIGMELTRAVGRVAERLVDVLVKAGLFLGLMGLSLAVGFTVVQAITAGLLVSAGVAYAAWVSAEHEAGTPIAGGAQETEALPRQVEGSSKTIAVVKY